MTEDALLMKDIYKSFLGVHVLTGVNFSLKAGEVHALLGENGAGKSTLIKILSGVYQPDNGEIIVNGELCTLKDPHAARAKGIGTIYQELCLVPNLTIAENIFLGRESCKGITHRVDYRQMKEKSKEILLSLHMDMNTTKKIKELSIAQQQMIEIVKAISFDAKIIIMDEPTSSLTLVEVDILFEIIKELKKKGIAVIYISHRMEEIFEIADSITVLRDGRNIGTKNIRETTLDELISMMVGRKLTEFYNKKNHVQDEIILEVQDLKLSKDSESINFFLRKGEILGVSGLVGAGRSEIVRALFGMDKIYSRQIFIEGKPVIINKPSQAMEHGFGLVPEDRKKEGIFLKSSIGYNITLLAMKTFLTPPVYRKDIENKIIDDQIQSLSIKAASKKQPTFNLSGGNQQKVVIARWLTLSPKVLILDEPTRGIDVGAKSEIYELMNDLTRKGVGIIMISSELPEVMNMSDRIMVVSSGRVTGVLQRELFDQELIMKYAIG
jgi:ABC-type sugar transport system ATPase subunit